MSVAITAVTPLGVMKRTAALLPCWIKVTLRRSIGITVSWLRSYWTTNIRCRSAEAGHLQQFGDLVDLVGVVVADSELV